MDSAIQICRTRLLFLFRELRFARLALVVLLVSVVCGTPSWGQSVAPSTILLSSRAIALNPTTGKVYAVAPRENAVAIFNPATNYISRVHVGAGAVALAINSVTNRIYVANSQGGSITVLDGTTDSVFATLDVGANPYVVAVNSVANKIYVSNTFSEVVTIIDGATNSMTKLKAGSADAIAIDPNLGKVYLLGYEDMNLTVLDDKPSIAGKLKVGIHPWDITIIPATSTLYVTRSGNAQLAVVDELSGSITTVPTGATPCAVALNTTTNTIYVVNHTDDTVTAIDATKHIVVAAIKVGHQPQGIAVDPIRNHIYVANTHDDSISVIDGSKNQVVKTLPTGKNPFALVVNPKTGQLFAATIAGSPLELTSEK